MDWLQSGTVKALLHICVESAQQILRILSNLLDQGLLGKSFFTYKRGIVYSLCSTIETFLPFDLDAAFMSTIPLLMAAAIDSSLLQDHSPWSQRAYTILDDMSIRGNLSARLIQSELKQLDDKLAQVLTKGNMAMTLSTNNLCRPGRSSESVLGIFPPAVSNLHSPSLEPGVEESFGQHYELSSEQLMELANSLDLNSLTWPMLSMDDLPGHEI